MTTKTLTELSQITGITEMALFNTIRANNGTAYWVNHDTYQHVLFYSRIELAESLEMHVGASKLSHYHALAITQASQWNGEPVKMVTIDSYTVKDPRSEISGRPRPSEAPVISETPVWLDLK